MPQVKMVKSIELVEGTKGIYHKITWEDGKADLIFDPEMLKVFAKAKAGNHAVEVTKEQKGKYWNIVEAKIITTEDLPAPTEPVRKYPEPPPDAPQDTRKLKEASSKPIISGQEIGLWWKELGESLRSGLIDRSKPAGKALEKFYKAKMLDVLGVKVETKQNPTGEPEAEN